MNDLELSKIIKSLEKEKWIKRGKWNQTVLIHEICGEGEMTRFQKEAGYPFKKTKQMYYKNDYFDLEKEWNDLNKKIEAEYAKNKNYLVEYAENCFRYGESVIKFSEKYEKNNHKQLSNNELSGLVIELIDKIKSYMPFMFSMHLVDDFLSKKFYEFLSVYSKNNKLSKQEYFEYEAALTLPFRKIFVLEERLEILKIAIETNKISKINKKTVLKIEKHAQKYGWMSMPNLSSLPLAKEDFLKKLKSVLREDYRGEYKKIISSEVLLRRKQKRLMDKISKEKDFLGIVKAIQIFGFLRSFRVDVPFISLHNNWGLIKEITKRLGIKTIDIRSLSSSEIKLALENKIDCKKLIIERKNNLMGIVINNKRYELVGKETEKVLPFIKFPKNKSTNNYLKGQIAFPGIIRGITKVLNSPREIKKVKKGDIIIVSMTDPNYIPAMEKASAFVTDEGGILCHAAIISREMKKPCIIGTKIATQVLKDGDLIEVDADKGIVKIIK